MRLVSFFSVAVINYLGKTNIRIKGVWFTVPEGQSWGVGWGWGLATGRVVLEQAAG